MGAFVKQWLPLLFTAVYVTKQVGAIGRRTSEEVEDDLCNSAWQLFSNEDVQRLANESCSSVQAIQVRDDVTSLVGLESLKTAGDIDIESVPKLKTLAGLDGLQTVSHIMLKDNTRLEGLAGLENLSSAGTFYIYSNERLGSLLALEKLTSVGNLTIDRNQRLVSLSGLQNLQNLGGTLSLDYNPSLGSLTGLEGLTDVRALLIAGNDALASLSGLQNLRTVGANLTIRSNDGLTSLSGLENLRTVGANLTIIFNDALTSLAGLQNLRTVGANLAIQYNDALTSLSGLENLQTIGGSFRLLLNRRLGSLTGLESLTSVSDSLDIYGTDELTNLSGLENLQSVGSLDLYYNIGLVSLIGLSLTSVPGSLTIKANSALTSLLGLESLQTVGGSFRLDRNFGLESLAGLEGLTSVSSSLTIHDNWRLTNLSGLRSLQRVSDSLIIQHNYYYLGDGLPASRTGLRSLVGLENLQTAGSLVLADNKDLESLTGLEKLVSLNTLRISNNDMLVSLTGLENLVRVLGDLEIEHQANLVSLEGLESLTEVGKLGIKDCDQLYSLQGLGTLQRAGLLSVEGSVPMSALGGPLATGAQVGTILIEEAVWPLCVTPHERAVLASAVDSLGGSIAVSAIPSATWQRWRDNSCGIEMVSCTKGHPCKFTLVGIEALERVFVSDQDRGCGVCSETELQGNVGEDGEVDFGYALKGLEGGTRSVCLCGDKVGPVTQLLLRGPHQSGLSVCSRGHACTFEVSGEALEPADHVVLMRSCNEGNPFLGFSASVTAGNTYLLHDLWQAAPPGSYEVCWRAPCSFSADGPTCPPPEDSYFSAGLVELQGPFPRNYIQELGNYLAVPNVGHGVSDGDRMRLRHVCGEASTDALDVLDAESRNLIFDFGILKEERVLAGSYRLCWCQPRPGVECSAEHHFMADSGALLILCPAGQELASSGSCMKCPPGRQNPAPGFELEPCSECPVGQFSEDGDRCETCPDGTVAELAGSAACVTVCQSWESVDAEAPGCYVSAGKVILLMLLFSSVGAFCAMLVWIVKRRLRVVDVSLDEGRTIVTVLGSHGLSNFGRPSFPAALRGTGHAAFDSPSQPLRVKVEDGARLELLTWEDSPIDSRLDTSMGTLTVAFPRDLFHQGWKVPAAFSLPVLFITAVILFAVAATDMATLALLGAAATALICAAASAAVRWWPRSTPLTQRLSHFKQRLGGQIRFSGQSCEKCSDCGISIGKLQQLFEFFRDFIRDRDAVYVDSNILQPLTKPSGLSYAELAGAGQAEWFVSHYWGTAFEVLCTALRKHAEAACGERDWTTLHYWLSLCGNSRSQNGGEFSSNWEETPLYSTLQSKDCKGTCMVLDDQALPLTRIWCVYELVQTLKLERNDEGYQGLLWCTSAGVLNMGSGSVEVATALAENVVKLDLASARAASSKDEEMVRAQMIQEMGSSEALTQFVRREVHSTLVHAEESSGFSSNEQFVAALARLYQPMACAM